MSSVLVVDCKLQVVWPVIAVICHAGASRLHAALCRQASQLSDCLDHSQFSAITRDFHYNLNYSDYHLNISYVICTNGEHVSS